MASSRRARLGVGLLTLASIGIASLERPAALAAQAASPTADAVSTLSADALLDDLAILRSALETLHPGLYRYNTPAEMEARFAALEQAWSREQTRAAAYLALSRFLAGVRCGHTYANFWNQTDEVKSELFGRADKVPFTFRLIDRRMLVTGDATEAGALPPGTEVLSIDGHGIEEILARLLPYMHADGSNDGMRLEQLQLSGIGDHEPFDVFHALALPPRDGAFELEVEAGDGSRRRVSVEAVSRPERRDRLARRYGPQPETVDDLWRFELADDGTGVLRIGSFVTWRMEMDWRAFLAESFEALAVAGATHLVLDLRGNAGGDNAVLSLLQRYLTWKEVEVRPARELLRYRTVPDELLPYLDTWDDRFEDRGDAVVETGDGFYIQARRSTASRTVRPREGAFAGTTYVLVGAANSSATLQLASYLQEHGLATLVGQETGGNQRGINGGQFFFLRLPGSRLEVDIPIFAYHMPGDPPDAGVLPDVPVRPSVEDVRAGIDTELEAARRLIADAAGG